MFGLRRGLIIVFCVFLCTYCFSQNIKKAKLVLGIVLENFNPDYLEKYSSDFSENGFKRLINNSAYYKNAFYPYMFSLTGVDHASIYTGTLPAEHGIISHAWYNRFYKKAINNVAPDTYSGSKEDIENYLSPKKLLVASLGDVLKEYSSCSRVFGIGMNAESAVISAGHRADAAYWFSRYSGKWRSSSYYMDSLYSWGKNFNNSLNLKYLINRGWYPLNQEFINSTYPSLSNRFYHDLLREKNKTGDYKVIKETPYANVLISDFAKDLIINENLGSDNDVDLLSVSYSFLSDKHLKYFTDEAEKIDALYRLDSDLADLFIFLDKQIGKNNYLVMLTVSDAMVDSPEELKKKKMPTGYFNSYKAIALLRSYLNIKFGVGDWILSYDSQQIYLNRLLIEKKKMNLRDVQNIVVSFFEEFEGIDKVIPSYALRFNNFAEGKEKRMHYSYNQKRSGDVMYSLVYSWTNSLNDREDYLAKYSYKRKVPLFFYGLDIKSKIIEKRVSVLDIAPSLLSKMGLPIMEECTGNILDF